MFVKKNKGFRVALGILQSLMALYWALAGTVLFYAMFFSHHTYTYSNLNIVYANPLLFAGVPFGILYAAAKHEHTYTLCSRVLKALWTYVLTGSVFTIVLRMAGFNYSDNTLTLLLIIPSAAVLSFLGDFLPAA
jgi:hypothetical protein